MAWNQFQDLPPYGRQDGCVAGLSSSEEESCIRRAAEEAADSRLCRVGDARPVRGFSLVEVTLALGVVAFAVLLMVGMNSASLSILSESRKEAVGQRIAQTVLARLQAESFSTLPPTKVFEYFNSEGIRVDGVEEAIYVASIDPTVSASFGETSFPPDAAAHLEVAVQHAPGGAGLHEETRQIFRMFVVLANREKSAP